MPDNLLTTIPETRINDCFTSQNHLCNFTLPAHATKDPIIQGTIGVDAWHYRFRADFYKKVGLDIVTETVMDYPYVFLTEKTYRPIINGRPFIILGSCHTLEFLCSLGFRTFPSIIDESYDHIHNSEQRFSKVCDSIKTFVDRPVSQVIADVKSVKETLLHNQHRMQQLVEDQVNHFKRQIEID